MCTEYFCCASMSLCEIGFDHVSMMYCYVFKRSGTLYMYMYLYMYVLVQMYAMYIYMYVCSGV